MQNSGFELQFFQSSNRRRAKTEVMEEISSQNSDLGLEGLDKLEATGQAENTKRATSWGIKKFEKWCNKRKLKVEREIHESLHSGLNDNSFISTWSRY